MTKEETDIDIATRFKEAAEKAFPDAGVTLGNSEPYSDHELTGTKIDLSIASPSGKVTMGIVFPQAAAGRTVKPKLQIKFEGRDHTSELCVSGTPDNETEIIMGVIKSSLEAAY